MHKIAVFRALQLGDLLCAMPAITALKYNYPESTLYFIGLPHMEALLERFDCVDEFIPFPGHPELPEIPCNPLALADFMKRMQAEKFDLLLQLQGNGTIVNDFLKNFGAKRLVGFRPSGSPGDSDWLEYPDKLHEVDRHLALIDFLGLRITNRAMEYPLFSSDWADFEVIKNSLTYPFVIVHVGSRDTKRQWPLEKFVCLAEYLHDRGYQIVLTGVLGEKLRIAEFENLLPFGALNLCAQLDLGVLGCLVRQASLVICNCTGISHIAAALETRSIVISMDGEPERWGPQNKRLHRIFDAKKSIQITDIFSAIDSLLEFQFPVGRNAAANPKISEE
ncbi:glycosyltransferase family 9 protein [Sphingobacterium sp. DR205]|uniref:glycosyltransferase family 9 protein n=1 Tax=Sphingobacterium sp. DR205 TaxID=2713573 RepID=UPI0013E50BBE|nr:glycosyltransferase family 9 protein [Sphingobacterium sp. DR205]QIH33988.1 glycosyltransferase family 9 protein [Sphingobacterium sp. DR205]